MANKVKVWDISTRAFHWLLVIAIFSCWLTMEMRWLDAHLYSGLFIAFLIIYRLIWGIIGAKTARFSDFVKWPWHAVRYLLKSFNRHDDYHAGHNPAGGWMVIIFLLVILSQVISGLFANDDIGFSGPLADWVVKQSSDFATFLHGWIFNALLGLIWLHLVIVFFYVLVKKQNLVKAMLTGKKPAQQAPGAEQLFFVSSFRIVLAFILALIVPFLLF
ncbi:cytochrome b/b6 domain-containing protein [Catenovulum sp. 2E275]|uniref:cytochrome b/b6 domain-containing protein n=1 Tax=Catenovulum sp. 2E275 TaxID=2980497 RepID=UPI0021D264E4|nr:cytochrome b/b6 domain-containing protein [Catenovulum sp. 2E275]MCU4676564.1 cytochrome b/b6 domain-containing protein [Catenovulum sp. 2E275]